MTDFRVGDKVNVSGTVQWVSSNSVGIYTESGKVGAIPPGDLKLVERPLPTEPGSIIKDVRVAFSNVMFNRAVLDNEGRWWLAGTTTSIAFVNPGNIREWEVYS